MLKKSGTTYCVLISWRGFLRKKAHCWSQVNYLNDLCCLRTFFSLFNSPTWLLAAANLVVHLFNFFLITHARVFFTFGLVFHGSPETCMALLSSTEAVVLPCMSRQRKREKYMPARTVKELILSGGSLITFFLPDNLQLIVTFTFSRQNFV